MLISQLQSWKAAGESLKSGIFGPFFLAVGGGERGVGKRLDVFCSEFPVLGISSVLYTHLQKIRKGISMMETPSAIKLRI